MSDVVNAAYPPELKILRGDARERVAAAIKAQAYYDGNFWNYIEWERSSTGTKIHKEVKDYPVKSAKELDYEPTRMELQYPKFFIDELASWMFENPVSLKGEDDVREPCFETHSDNKLDQGLLQSAVEGCLTGGIALKVLWNAELGKLRVIPRPSRECFPITHPDDVAITQKVAFAALQDDEKNVWRQTFEVVTPSGGQKACWVKEEMFKIDSLKDGNPRPSEVLRDEPLYMGNKYIDFIPVVIIPNEPDLGAVFGKSDLNPLYTPISEICRKFSDFADALTFELFPITVFTNCNFSENKPPKIKPGAFFNLKSGGDAAASASKLESSIPSKDSVEWFINQLLDACHQFSGVPRITRDKVDSVGNISGIALTLMYASIISKTNRKLIYWKPGLEQMYDFVLKSRQVYEGLSYNPDHKVTVETHTKLPTNEMEQVELEAKRIEMLVIGVVDVMKSNGVENPEEKLAQILAEKTSIEEALTAGQDIYGARVQKEGAPPQQGV